MMLTFVSAPAAITPINHSIKVPQEQLFRRSSKQAPLVSALSGRAGYVEAQQLSGGDEKAKIWNGGVTFACPDLLSEGNAGCLIVGVPPQVTRNDN
jgi:hypothetical protein